MLSLSQRWCVEWSLCVDDLVLMSEAIERHGSKFWNRKDAFVSNVCKSTLGIHKLMVISLLRACCLGVTFTHVGSVA